MGFDLAGHCSYIREVMKKVLFLFLVASCPYWVVAQHQFSGHVDASFQEGQVYLSVVEDYRKISGVYPEQILQKTTPNSDSFFSFQTNNLPSENRIYRIHVDTCSEDDQNINHFTGHCESSKEILFVANNRDTLSLPLAFENEMFCTVVSTNEKTRTFLKIDSIKNEMRYNFGTYRSEANRKMNTEKWFNTLQDFGVELNEPLAELYIFAFLSDRANNLHAYYLQDLKSNDYYDGLLARLKQSYPSASYTTQFEAELSADKFLVFGKEKKQLPWWVFLVGGIALLSIVGNLYFFGKTRKNKTEKASVVESLSNQEKKVLELILQHKTNKEIASEMFVSVSTVKTHINNLYKKLKVSSRDEVISKFQTGV